MRNRKFEKKIYAKLPLTRARVQIKIYKQYATDQNVRHNSGRIEFSK